MSGALPIGATCAHPRMRCPNGESGCGKDCGHWWCPDCGLSWDDGFEGGFHGGEPLTELCFRCGEDTLIEVGAGYACLWCLMVGLHAP